MIHQTPARLPHHQQIEVAVFIGFTAGYGAEDTQAVCAAPPRKLKNFLPPFRPQCVQSDHISIVRRIPGVNHSAEVPSGGQEVRQKLDEDLAIVSRELQRALPGSTPVPGTIR